MDESQFQLGIRQLSPHDLVTLVSVYRNKLKGCQKLCEDFAQNNYAQDVMHKVICGYLAADIDVITKDYNEALRKERS